MIKLSAALCGNGEEIMKKCRGIVFTSVLALLSSISISNSQDASFPETFGLDQLKPAPSGELPVGTILQSILPPDAFLRVKPAGVWVLGNGSQLGDQNSPLAVFMKLNRNSYYDLALFNEKDEVRMPDLGGVFLRGVDATNDGTGDDVLRKIGSHQKDEVGPHTHWAAHTFPTSINAPDLDAGNTALTLKDWRPVYPNAPEAITHANDGSETRPENIAVYVYIRVK